MMPPVLIPDDEPPPPFWLEFVLLGDAAGFVSVMMTMDVDPSAAVENEVESTVLGVEEPEGEGVEVRVLLLVDEPVGGAVLPEVFDPDLLESVGLEVAVLLLVEVPELLASVDLLVSDAELV